MNVIPSPSVYSLFQYHHGEVGLLYLVLSILLFALAFFRARRSRHDFADRSEVSALYRRALPTVGQEDKREYGRPFITAGRDVLAVGALVMTVEILLLVFVLQV
ncbi:hypothetical protein AZE42_01344 [Rhizopogon vesiculosus]|uniref:Uncharacterized protein n=1 Tax=Rhizopogon vesiculosus TaxID=180088 RepID=A0A1J8QK62_9AGAM|nr:hypothetical protein AZE42_01344 [Rhizopogon vesiculosus]